MQSLVVSAEPVHDRDWQSARCDLPVALHVELVVDVLDGVHLVLPGLDTGAEITAGHHHGLEQESSANVKSAVATGQDTTRHYILNSTFYCLRPLLYILHFTCIKSGIMLETFL